VFVLFFPRFFGLSSLMPETFIWYAFAFVFLVQTDLQRSLIVSSLIFNNNCGTSDESGMR
jgi:hypothetical protein